MRWRLFHFIPSILAGATSQTVSAAFSLASDNLSDSRRMRHTVQTMPDWGIYMLFAFHRKSSSQKLIVKREQINKHPLAVLAI
jgi:uncharacterized protein YpiB (UPF0302 family)